MPVLRVLASDFEALGSDGAVRKKWRDITPLELLLAERLRRAEAIECEAATAQELRDKARAAISTTYDVTRSRRHCVRGADVVKVARDGIGPTRALGLYRLILNVVEEMGGLLVYPRNRFMVNGFRPIEMSDVEGVAYAKSLRRDPWAEEHPEYFIQWERRKARRLKYREGDSGT